MFICKVQGKCVSTIKNSTLVGSSLVTVQRLNKSGTASGELMVVVDMLGCSVGETVLVTTGSSARAAMGNPSSAADMAIVGIVDTCDFSK